MQSVRAARAAARKILGPRLTALTKQPFRRMFATKYRSHLRLRRGLEMGGPSAMFAGNGGSPFTMFLGRCTTACVVEAQFGPEGCERETPSFMIPPGSLVSRSSVRPRIRSLSKTPATNVFWHAIALSTLPILFGHSQSSEASRDRYLTPDWQEFLQF